MCVSSSHVYRKSASCTHISAVLHALSALKPSFDLRQNLPLAECNDDDPEVPVTSLLCQWKPPKKRKESTLQIADATFEKYDYEKPVKRKVTTLKDFDPRPPQFRGTAKDQLPQLLSQLKGNSFVYPCCLIQLVRKL